MIESLFDETSDFVPWVKRYSKRADSIKALADRVAECRQLVNAVSMPLGYDVYSKALRVPLLPRAPTLQPSPKRLAHYLLTF
jgi:hypothetical protein